MGWEGLSLGWSSAPHAMLHHQSSQSLHITSVSPSHQAPNVCHFLRSLQSEAKCTLDNLLEVLKLDKASQIGLLGEGRGVQSQIRKKVSGLCVGVMGLCSIRLPELDHRYAGGSGAGLPAADLQGPHGGEGG